MGAVGLGRLMKGICHQWWVKRRQGQQIIHMFENVGRVLVLLAAAALLLLIWEINVSPLLASAGIVANTKIINESAPEPRYRVRIKVGAAYDSNLKKVEAALLKVANSNQSISHDPEARVRLRAFGDSSLEFELLCWAKTPADRGRVIHELNSAIFEEFKKKWTSVSHFRSDTYTCILCRPIRLIRLKRYKNEEQSPVK